MSLFFLLLQAAVSIVAVAGTDASFVVVVVAVAIVAISAGDAVLLML